MSGAGKTDDQHKQETKNYPTILSFNGEQNFGPDKNNASFPTNLITLTYAY